MRAVSDLAPRKDAMKLQRFISISFVCLGLAYAGVTYAFDLGNMMNPSRWAGGGSDRDRYNDDYGYGDYGYGGAPGYGYGGMPGYGYGGMPGYGGYGGMPGNGGYGGMPGYGGYGGMPGYGGYGGMPGYGSTPAYNAPGSNSDAEEIKRLKDRIKKLEESSRSEESSQWDRTYNQEKPYKRESDSQWYNR